MSAGWVFAHTDSPGSPPLVPQPLRLKHRKPSEIIALFSREQLPDRAGSPSPRAARVDTEESLVPPGVDALLPAEAPDQLIVVGTERVPDISDCIQVLDAPVVKTGPDREKIALTLRRADAQRLRAAILRFSKPGRVVLQGRQLLLEGTRARLHRALRQVIRAELKQPDSAGLRFR
jgi:hypothetical protein